MKYLPAWLIRKLLADEVARHGDQTLVALLRCEIDLRGIARRTA